MCSNQLVINQRDNNSDKELSAATISRWICNTVVEIHAVLNTSKSLPKTGKAHEVCVIATVL